MLCKACGSKKIVRTTSFSKDKQPETYYKCKTCYSESKRKNINFDDILNSHMERYNDE